MPPLPSPRNYTTDIYLALNRKYTDDEEIIYAAINILVSL